MRWNCHLIFYTKTSSMLENVRLYETNLFVKGCKGSGCEVAHIGELTEKFDELCEE